MRRAARVCFALAVLASVGARAIAHRDPIALTFHNRLYFPIFRFYPASTFDDDTAVAPDYRTLAARGTIRAWFPPIPFGPNDADWLMTHSPPTAPDARHWLGTDDLGRDVLVRLLYGFRVSLFFGLLTWASSALLGQAIGVWQGYQGGLPDLVAQRVEEIWTALPVLHIALFALCVFAPSVWLLAALWIAFGWLPFAAYARTETLRVRNEPFVNSARAAGVRPLRLLWRHILPHTLTPLRALTPLVIGANIGALAGLDYLGLGLPPPGASWGELLRQGRENPDCWWLLLFPLTALVLVMAILPFLIDKNEST